MSIVRKPLRSRSKPPACDAGLTLIEVIVGLVLMATLLMTSWTAISQQRRHRAFATKKQQACQVAESIVSQWYERNGQIPLRAQGFAGSMREWSWQTQVVGTASLCGMQLPIVRLEVMGRVGTDHQPHVLCSLELVQREPGSGH